LFIHLTEISKDSRTSLLLRTFGLLCSTWIVTIVVVQWTNTQKAPTPDIPHLSAEQVLVELGKNLSDLRARYQTLLQSSARAAEVNRDAGQLAEKILEVRDNDLGLDMQIFKYQSLAYSWGIVAGSEIIASSE